MSQKIEPSKLAFSFRLSSLNRQSLEYHQHKCIKYIRHIEFSCISSSNPKGMKLTPGKIRTLHNIKANQPVPTITILARLFQCSSTIVCLSRLLIRKNLDNNELTDIAKTLSKQIEIKKLSLKIASINVSVTAETLFWFTNYLSRLVFLEDLSIDLSQVHFMPNESLIYFGKLVQRLSNLQSLYLAFTDRERLTDIGILSLAKSMPFLSLKKLTLDFSGCEKISDNGITHICKSIVRYKGLEMLNLRFMNCKKISDESVALLVEVVSLLNSIKSVDFCFIGCKVTDAGLLELSNLSYRKKQITDLEIDLSLCDKVSVNGVAKLGQSLLTYENLLKLNFGFCQKSTTKGYVSSIFIKRNSECINLFVFFSKLTNLTQFKLRFSPGFSFTDTEFQELGRCFSGMKNLKILSLEFPWSPYLTGTGVFELGQSISSLSSITDFSLDFYHGKLITDDAIKGITQFISKNDKFKTLSIQCYKCKQITDNSLISISYALLTNFNLRYLNINFALCSKISDKSMSQLASSLPQLTKLNYLYLNFALWKYSDMHNVLSAVENRLKLDLVGSNITDKGFSNVADGIAQLTQLCEIGIYLNDVNSIADLTLNSISRACSVNKGLNKLQLALQGTKISNDSTKQLGLSLKSLANLKEVFLSLGARIKRSEFWDLAEKLKSIHSVQIIHDEFMYPIAI